MRRRIIKLIFLMLIVNFSLNAQGYLTPHSIGVAGAYVTQSRGYEALGWNPANLALSDNPKFSITSAFLLAPLPQVYLTNSTISRSWIDEYIFSGKTLNNSAITNLLKSFPDEGLALSSTLDFRLFALSIKHFAFAIDIYNENQVTVPKDIFRTIFKGVHFEQPIKLNTLDVNLISVLSLSAGYGFPINLPILNRISEEVYVGIAPRLLIGLTNGYVDSIDGDITTSEEMVRIRGKAVANLALGGYGLGMDLGLTAIISERLKADLALINLPGFISWGSMDVKTFYYEIDWEVPSDEFEDLANSDIDSVFNEEVTDSIYSADKYSSLYPGHLNAGIEFRILDNLTLFAVYRQDFSDKYNNSFTPRLSTALEYRPIGWLPFRLGLALGGNDGFQWSAGWGLHLGFYHLDFGFAQSGGMFNNAKGFILALGQSLYF